MKFAVTALSWALMAVPCLLVHEDVAHACTNSCGATDETRLVKAGNASSLLGFNGDHAWADAWRTGNWDVVNNFGGGNTSCASTSGSSGCSSHYSAWYASWGSSNCSTFDYMKCQYTWADNLTYGVTGVCHQSANRANGHFSNVPWVKNVSIAGGTTSYVLYCNCGESPLGYCYSCN
jgi:hypothetical protein